MTIATSIVDAEIDRLQYQATVWEAEADVMLDHIGVGSGWSCIDIGCGPAGILEPLSRRVRPNGRVIGLDIDDRILTAARRYMTGRELSNVELASGDAHEPRMLGDTFDLVHERFVLPLVDSPEALLGTMCRLANVGGIIAVQELDLDATAFRPPKPAWARLKDVIERTFSLRGDIKVGQRVHGMLHRAGLRDVTIRSVARSFDGRHPYARWPINGVNTMRRDIVDAGIATAADLDELRTRFDACLSNDESYEISFTLMQGWGRKPAPNGGRSVIGHAP